MTILSATAALLDGLRAEGQLVSGAAPWGARVHLRRTSDVVEVAGPDTGNPVKVAWPCLLLFGPDPRRMKEHTTPQARVLSNYNADAGTVQVAPWPRFFELTFTVVWQTRSGVNTGSVSAERQLLAGISHFERWCELHPKVDGAALFTAKALGSMPNVKPTAADIFEARGSIRLAWVQDTEAAVTVDTAETLVVTASAVRVLP